MCANAARTLQCSDITSHGKSNFVCSFYEEFEFEFINLLQKMEQFENIRGNKKRFDRVHSLNENFMAFKSLRQSCVRFWKHQANFKFWQL